MSKDIPICHLLCAVSKCRHRQPLYICTHLLLIDWQARARCLPGLIISGFENELSAGTLHYSCVRTTLPWDRAVQRQVARYRSNKYMMFISCCL